MQKDSHESVSPDGPPSRGPDGPSLTGAVGRVRSPSGEELEVADLRVAPADVEKLRQIVSARGGAVVPAGAGDADAPAGSAAVVRPMDGSGMHPVGLRSSEPGWVLGTLEALRGTQTL